MFDPFGDFAEAGYLRNTNAEKNLELVKIAEHELFRAQLPLALKFLSKCKRIGYADFLKVHEIIFNALYPWAGKDRAEVLPARSVSKGSIFFCHPKDCRRAVEEGLLCAQDKNLILTKPGFIMGLFAYGHPFLDGNGRTMLIIHSELCFRAGISIDWMRTSKNPYLTSLSLEIENPGMGHLDQYMRPFIGEKITRDHWMEAIAEIPGLDGVSTDANTSSKYDNPDVTKKYLAFEKRRKYKFMNTK